MYNLSQFRSLIEGLRYVDADLNFYFYLFRAFILKEFNSVISLNYPLNIVLDITDSCNARCHFCYKRQSKNCGTELSLVPIKNLIRQLPKKKLYFLITGGEPLLHRFFFEILELIKEKNFSCGIVTNGTLLDEEKIRKLLSEGLDYIFFSLHGTKETHDSITGISGSYDKIIDSIRLFNKIDTENRCKIYINSVLTKKNINSFQKLFSDLGNVKIESFRIEHPSFCVTNEIRRTKQRTCNLLGEKVDFSTYIKKKIELDPEEVINLQKKLKNIQNPARLYFKPHLSKKEIRQWYSRNNHIQRKCYFQYISVYVSAQGDVYPCQFWRMKMGNIIDESIQEIWNNSRYRKLRKFFAKKWPLICRRCCKI